MNGEIGKLPSGVAYSSTPDSVATSASTEYSTVNGVVETSSYHQNAGAVSSPPSTSAAPSSSISESNIPLDQLKQLLATQLEYYFSRENLANDAYLLSQMDNDQYVPIWTVANFNQVKKLTKDIKLITDVLRESPNVQVDEEGHKVRPNHKRCIVILREIPENTPIDDIKGLFMGENCPRCISCEFAHNNAWYVTFESDEDAQKAYRFLREEVREFQGKPIMARIKAKPMNRLPIPPVPPMNAMKNGYRNPTVYDPSTTPAYPNQQRYVYTNGSTINTPPSVNYGNQVQLYAFHHQQQPFYHPSMLQLQSWGHAGPAYYDIGSVFSVNGLAPQGNFKPQTSRYSSRNRPKRNQSNSDRGSVSDNTTALSSRPGSSQHNLSQVSNAITLGTVVNVAPIPRTGGAKAASSSESGSHSKSQEGLSSSQQTAPPAPVSTPTASARTSEQEDSGSTMARASKDVHASKEPLPARVRRRRKEDESSTSRPPPSASAAPSSSKQSPSPQPGTRDAAVSAVSVLRGSQFDLKANAFPPLPGAEGASSPTGNGHEEVSDGSPWENRPVPVVKSMADKATKTDDVLLNGDISVGTKTPPPPAVDAVKPTVAAQGKTAPTTTNAATMTNLVVTDSVAPAVPSTCTSSSGTSTTTTVSTSSTTVSTSCSSTNTQTVVVTASCSNKVSTQTSTTTVSLQNTTETMPLLTPEPSCSGNSARLSYAQVAQHHKQRVERLMREQQEKQAEQEKEKKEIKEPSTRNSQTKVISRDARDSRFINRGPRPSERTERTFRRDRTSDRPLEERDRFRRERTSEDRFGDRDRPRYQRDFAQPRSPK